MNFDNDRMLASLLDLVGNLAHRLTGEHPMICIWDKQGNLHHRTLGVGGVQWFADPVDATCCIHTKEWFQDAAAKGLINTKDEPITEPAAQQGCPSAQGDDAHVAPL